MASTATPLFGQERSDFNYAHSTRNKGSVRLMLDEDVDKKPCETFVSQGFFLKVALFSADVDAPESDQSVRRYEDVSSLPAGCCARRERHGKAGD